MGRLSDVANGLYGAAPAPYGWVNVGKRIRHNRDEWPVVQKIIKLRFEWGLTIIEIAEVLNRSGKRTRTGKRWGYYSVRSVLSKMHIHDEKAYHMGRHMMPTLVIKQNKETDNGNEA